MRLFGTYSLGSNIKGTNLRCLMEESLGPEPSSACPDIELRDGSEMTRIHDAV